MTSRPFPIIRPAVPALAAFDPRPAAWAALVSAIGIGVLVGSGHALLAGAVVAVPAVALWAFLNPQKAVWGLLAALPLLFYGLSVGSLSLFFGLPVAVFLSLALLARVRPAAAAELPRLPVAAFVVLVGVATASAALSERPLQAGSRVVYILAFGLLAWALARAIACGLLTRRAVVTAIVAGAALAAVVVLGQFVAQFVIDRELLLEHMRDLYARFGGERAAQSNVENWVVPNPPLLGDIIVRGAVPFMVVPSAGQYLMIALLAAIWLAFRAPGEMTPAARTAAWVAVALIGCALLATYSRQSFLGALAGLAVMFGWHRRTALLLLAAPLAAIAAIVPLPGSGRTLVGQFLLGGESERDEFEESFSARLDLILDAPSQVAVSPIVGVGPGQYSILSPGGDVFYAHNLLLDSAVELGVIGAIALLMLFGAALVSATRISPGLGPPLLVAYLVANLFDDTFYFPRNGFLLAAVFALACTASRDSDPVPRISRGARRPQPSGGT